MNTTTPFTVCASCGFTGGEHSARCPRSLRRFALEHPAAAGDTVQQGHADYCAAYGHGAWLVDGVDQGRCSRCGAVTAPAAPAARTYTFESARVTDLILAATGTVDAFWEPDELCEAVTNTIRYVHGDACTVYIGAPEDGDHCIVTAPVDRAPATVELMIARAVQANLPHDEQD